MNIDFTLSNLRLFTRTGRSGAYLDPGPVAAPVRSDQQRLQVQLTRRRVLTLQDALSDINDILQSTRGTVQPRKAQVTSSTNLLLDNSETATTASSSEQVNATATSFTPFGPGIDGDSTAEVTIEGVYNGENGDDTLRFLVRTGGTHGEDDLKIRVYNGAGSTIKNITIKDSDAADKTYNIGNGLKLTLGSGDLGKNDEFFVDVSASTGSVVNPDKAFDGTRNDQPNFEYGTSVGAGGFDINGTSIAVYASDSINTVLDRINGSGAGVTATFNATTEKIDLVSNEAGSAATIAIDNDTSGFVAATKLSSAVVTEGRDADIDTALTGVDRFVSVTSGTIIVNGENIAIDTSVDTLNDIVARISAQAEGLTAKLIDDAQRVQIFANESGTDIQLDDGGTGFLASIGIDPGLYEGVLENTGMSSQRATQLADAVDAAVGAINDLGNNARIPSAPDSLLRNLRAGLQRAAAGGKPYDAGEQVSVNAPGLRFDLGLFDGAIGDAVSFDRQGFRQLAQRHPEAINDFFRGSADVAGPGFLERLRTALSGYASGMANQFGAVGSLLDVFI